MFRIYLVGIVMGFSIISTSFSEDFALDHTLDIQELQKQALEEHLSDVASLKIKVYQEYPYFYDGDLEEEKNYLKRYEESKENVLIIAKDGETVIGAISGEPVVESFEEVKNCFLNQNRSIENIFYFEMIVVSKAYRGKGIGSILYKALEDRVKSLNRFSTMTFCEIFQEEKALKKPSGYFSLDNFWIRRGYKKNKDLKMHFPWKKIGEEKPTKSVLIFWEKNL